MGEKMLRLVSLTCPLTMRCHIPRERAKRVMPFFPSIFNKDPHFIKHNDWFWPSCQFFHIRACWIWSCRKWNKPKYLFFFCQFLKIPQLICYWWEPIVNDPCLKCLELWFSGREAQLLVLHRVTFFYPPRPPGSWGKPVKSRAAAIKAECFFQQPTLRVWRLTLHGFSSSNTAEWVGSIPFYSRCSFRHTAVLRGYSLLK